VRITARTLARLADRYDAREAWGSAARCWREAIARDGRSAEWHFKWGRDLEHLGNHTGAAYAYKAAIARDPRPARWHFRLGQVLRRTGEWPAARAAHREAVRRGPEQAPTLKGRRGKQLPFLDAIELSVVRKPAYAYGLYRAASTASRLGIPSISAVELGVAGGRGLLALEQHARDLEQMFGVGIDVFGFDTGEGLLPPKDHRDLPYHFAEGNYSMDEAALRARLNRATLILGDASVKFPELFDRGMSPIGFISFDMDHYTPTSAVLQRFGDASIQERFLPRVPLYFDDVVGKRGQDYNDFTGELLAIHEFNRENEFVKIGEDRYFRSLPMNLEWHHGAYLMHRFEHPRYDEYISTSSPASLGLR
jgi:hypothetical protein